jgi:hypothetical protein
MPLLQIALFKLPGPLAGWPDWLVVSAAAVAVVAGLWILGKLLKLAFWLVLVAVVAAGLIAVALWFFG